MRKWVTGILAFLYLLASSGVVLNVHYCMGRVADVELFAGHNDTCGKCGMKERKGGCCSDELKMYKLDDAHKQVEVLQSPMNHAGALLPVQPLAINCPPPADLSHFVTILHPPPNLSSPPLYLSNRVFRI